MAASGDQGRGFPRGGIGGVGPVGADTFARSMQKPASETDLENLRFQVELEFVQCLSNPHYLNFLAQRGYFKDSKFINYLVYLQYWRKSEYAKFLKYPQCLHFLELLQYEHFRKELVNSQRAKFIDDQQLLHWQHYARKRIRLQQMQLEAHQQQRQQHQQPQQSGSTQPMMQQGNDIPPLQQLQNHQK